MDDLDLDSSAWRFALLAYGRPGVAEECLGLQDRFGVDVSLLLVCLWLGREGGVALSGAEFDSLEAVAAAWRDLAVTPLRGVRRGLKASALMRHEPVAGFRQRLQKTEIEAERIEIALLHAEALRLVARPGEGRAEAALANLRLVLARSGAPPDLALPRLSATLTDPAS